MKKILCVVALVFASLSFTGCSLDDGSTIKYVPLTVISAEVPDSFELGQVYEITVTYLNPNNCTIFEGFDIHKHELTTREVYPIGAEVMGDNDCQEIATEVERTFNFEVIYDQDYVFQFWTGQDANGVDEYIEIDVPVN